MHLSSLLGEAAFEIFKELSKVKERAEHGKQISQLSEKKKKEHSKLKLELWGGGEKGHK